MKPRPPFRRRGRVNLVWLLLALGAVAIAGLIVMLNSGGRPGTTASGRSSSDGRSTSNTSGDASASGTSQSGPTLSLQCAAGLRVPVEEVAQQYKEEYGVTIEPQYDGSNTLLSKLEVNKLSDADLYLAGDDFYTDKAREEGLAAETMPIAHMRPVIAVRKDAKKKIASLKDLLAADVRVALANPDAAAIGKAARSRLQKFPAGDSTLWEQLDKNITEHGVYTGTVSEIATDVKIGSVDAGIVWDSTVEMPKYRDELVAVHVPELDGDPNLVSIAVLNSSKQPTEALKFARYLTARDRGLPHFAKYGMLPVEGDVWEEHPEITFFCGAVNRRAIDKLVEDFAAREGVSVNTVYNGCGILTGTMKTIADQDPHRGFPEVYMACDVYYLENVKEWFQEAANVSDCEIVIVVPKGSTKVKALEDLLEPGIRVAVGNPDQCTIGALTRRMLQEEGLYDKLKEKQQQPGEVVVEKASSAQLVPDVATGTGTCDAAMAYITDALANRDTVDIVHIKSDHNLAIQPFSIAKTSDHKYLLRRLFKKIAASPEAFEQVGFHFRLNQPGDKPESDAP